VLKKNKIYINVLESNNKIHITEIKNKIRRKKIIMTGKRRTYTNNRIETKQILKLRPTMGFSVHSTPFNI
jgi:hypothetical protein